MLGIYKIEDGVKYKYGKDDIIESIVRIIFTLHGLSWLGNRSEERRVGKEC